MQITIEKLTTDKAASKAFKPLFERYAAETGIKAFGKENPTFDMYRHAEKSGILRAFCAVTDAGDPVGLIVGIASLHPHFSEQTLSVDSIFVDKPYRNSSVSARLLSALFRTAKEGEHILISCVPGTDLDRELSHQKKFELVSKVFRRK